MTINCAEYTRNFSSVSLNINPLPYQSNSLYPDAVRSVSLTIFYTSHFSILSVAGDIKFIVSYCVTCYGWLNE